MVFGGPWLLGGCPEHCEALFYKHRRRAPEFPRETSNFTPGKLTLKMESAGSMLVSPEQGCLALLSALQTAQVCGHRP